MKAFDRCSPGKKWPCVDTVWGSRKDRESRIQHAHGRQEGGIFSMSFQQRHMCRETLTLQSAMHECKRARVPQMIQMVGTGMMSGSRGVALEQLLHKLQLSTVSKLEDVGHVVVLLVLSLAPLLEPNNLVGNLGHNLARRAIAGRQECGTATIQHIAYLMSGRSCHRSL